MINWGNILDCDLDAGIIGLMYDFSPCDINLLETLTWAHRIRQHTGFQQITGLTKSPRSVKSHLQRALARQIASSALRKMELDDEAELRIAVLEIYEMVSLALNEVVETGLSVMFNTAKDCPSSTISDPFFELVVDLISLIKDPAEAKDARSRFAALRPIKE